MVADHCRYRNHATHQIHFHSQQNESLCIFSPCHPRSLPYRGGYCPFFWRFFHSTRLQLLNFVNKTLWWSRFSFCTCRHPELWSLAACRPLTSLAAKRAKLQSTILLPLETRNVVHGNTVILNPKLCHCLFSNREGLSTSL